MLMCLASSISAFTLLPLLLDHLYLPKKSISLLMRMAQLLLPDHYQLGKNEARKRLKEVAKMEHRPG